MRYFCIFEYVKLLLQLFIRPSEIIILPFAYTELTKSAKAALWTTFLSIDKEGPVSQENLLELCPKRGSGWNYSSHWLNSCF